MHIIRNLDEWHTARNSSAFMNKHIGFVPTMGNLHKGHASLIQRSKQENEITILSIFINPTQFNDTGDFESYPKTWHEDTKLAEELGVDILLAPYDKEMYSDDFSYRVEEKVFSKCMEGRFRHNHFTGVLTVVLKLLNLVRPTNLYLGEKDYQQLILIKNMIKSFFLPINVIACPTIREESGLAFSSRNNRLSGYDKALAGQFSQLLKSDLSNSEIRRKLHSLGFIVEYITELEGRRFGAVNLGNVRLIDNFKLNS